MLYCTGDGHVHEYNLATGGWTDLTMQTAGLHRRN